MMPTGFSIATRGQSCRAKVRKNATEAYCAPDSFLSLNHRAPLTVRSVQGGNARIMSHG